MKFSPHNSSNLLHFILFTTFTILFLSSPLYAQINNSDVTPKIIPDNRVTLEASDNGALKSPDWLKTLILVEVNIETASEDGKFSGMTRLLNHLQEIGVNGIWLTPINDNTHYTNFGPATVNKVLTGQDDYEKGWKVVKDFVDQAHARNIRVFFDVISWGTDKKAPLFLEKREWYTGKSDFGGWAFDWKNKELNEWFAARLVDYINKTGGDGFRCDCAPGYAGYEPYRVARERLLAQGRKIALISETASERKGVFDFDQFTTDDEGRLTVRDAFLSKYNIVDATKTGVGIDTTRAQKAGESGRHRFYSLLVSCHDNKKYTAQGSLIVMGYEALFSPYIPIWYLGEEWNNPTTVQNDMWMYANVIDWKKIDENRAFYELVKKMIRIRRQHPNIFEYFPENHRDINICKVTTDHTKTLQAYARYKNGTGIIIVPNNSEKDDKFQITIPDEAMGLNKDATCTITELLSEKKIASDKLSDITTFNSDISKGTIGVFLIKMN